MSKIGSTSLPGHWGRPWAVRVAATPPPTKRSSRCCANGPDRTFLQFLAPSIGAAGIATLDLLETSGELLQRLRENTAYFRSEMVARHFEIPESDHPIVPIMIGDAVEAAAMADRLLAEGIYVRAFSYPVVPRGKARIRTQMSAAHSRDDLDQAITAFEKVRR